MATLAGATMASVIDLIRFHASIWLWPSETANVLSYPHITVRVAVHTQLAIHVLPHRRAVNVKISNGELQVLESQSEERRGAPHVKHEHTRLRRRRPQLVLCAGEARTPQQHLTRPTRSCA